MFTSAFRSTKSPKSPVLTRDWRLKKNDAIIWIIKNQFGRRNLTAYDRSILALKLKPVIAAKAKENLATHTSGGYQGLENSTKAVDTRLEIAKAAGVSDNTIARVEKIEAQASDEVNLQIAQESKDFWNTAAAVGTFRRGDFDNDTGNRRADGAEASTSAPSPQPAAGVINHDTTTSRSYHVSKSRLLEIILS